MTRSAIVICIVALLGGCVVLPLDYPYHDHGYRYDDHYDRYRDRGYGHRHDWGDRDRGDGYRRDDDRR